MDATTTYDDPTIFCHRCGEPDGVAFRGWQILCQVCIDSELDEWFGD